MTYHPTPRRRVFPVRFVEQKKEVGSWVQTPTGFKKVEVACG